jgi:hypothetical protein
MYKRATIMLLAIFLTAVALIPSGRKGSVTVRCPGGPAQTVYYYDLVGEGVVRTIAVAYSPEDPETEYATAMDVPLGSYRLLENGVDRAQLVLTGWNASVLIEAEEDWPLMPPK